MREIKHPQGSINESRGLLFSHREKIFIVVIGFAVYFNAHFNGFVFDDIPQVLKNPWIKDIRYLPDIFLENVWGFIGEHSNYYRPLMHVTYMLNYHVFGLIPWGFHLVNVLFHIGGSLLVYLVVLQLLNKNHERATGMQITPALAAALLFATHPIHTEVVTAIMGVPDVAFTFFFLLSFYLYIRLDGRPHDGYTSYALSIIFFFIALLFKEPAIILIVVIAAHDYLLASERPRSLNFTVRYMPYIAMVAIYMMLRILSIGNVTAMRRHEELSTYEYLINVLPLFSLYLQKLLFPINLNFLHTYHPIRSLLEVKAIVSLMVVGGYVVSVWMAWKKSKIAFLGLLLIALPLLPALYVPGLNQELENAFAERYLYLPSFGFVLLAALFISYAEMKHKITLKVLKIATILMIVLYSIGTVYRNTTWKDNKSLFEDAVKKSPNGAYPHIYLGNALFNDAMDIDGAIEQYEIGLKMRPDNVDVHNKIGLAYRKKGRIDKAIEHYIVALKLSPYFAPAHNNLGLAYFDMGWIDKAIEEYAIAIRLRPKFVEAHNNLGVAYFRTGLTREAIQHYQVALKLNPDFAHAHNNIGVAYASSGFIDKAIWHFEKVTRLNPNDVNARNNLKKAKEEKAGHDRAYEGRK